MRASGRMRTRRHRVNESAVDNLGRGSGACLVVNVHPPRSFEVFKSLAKLHVPVPSTAILGTRAPPSDLGASAFTCAPVPRSGGRKMARRNDDNLAVGVSSFYQEVSTLDFCFDCNVRYNVRPTRLEVHGGLGAAAAVKHTAHNLRTTKHERASIAMA